MNPQEALQRYVELCTQDLAENPRVLGALKREGIVEPFLLETFRLGYAGGRLAELAQGNGALNEVSQRIGLLTHNRETLKGCLTIPLSGYNGHIANIVGYHLHPQAKKRVRSLNGAGIFNESFLRNVEQLVLTESPLEALLLIQAEVPWATFVVGDDEKYVHFIQEHHIRRVVFTFEGRARLYYELARGGISARRVTLDRRRLVEPDAKGDLAALLSGEKGTEGGIPSDAIQEIEGGFVFRFPQLSYRVIGNFTDYGLSMRANLKAFTDAEVFVDALDLYKNRDRQNLIYNLMERFGLRDQVQLEKELHQMIDVIEKHRQKKEQEKMRIKPQLTEYQKDVGMRFLTSPHLIDEIDADYTHLGYVRERKNKILLYLIMTSRLMEHPLHGILISRSGAGKSLLVEITETLCPPEDVESISDLSPQALFYYGEDDLKNRFIVIGEKEGSQGADYPLRELITRRSLTKAIPMKDATTGEIKTVTIRVNGPISLAETTTSGNVNQENLNRCFVLSIDESEEQTRLIHELQRRNYTLTGYLQRRELSKIIEKHVYAQRLLRPVLVFNPYAEALSFPTASLRTRRDNEKFLRLINVICFLHQYQRKLQRKKITEREVVEYIDCTPEDYRIAYDLLADGVLDNTLDDLPAPARKLLELTKRYLEERSRRDGVPVEKIVFERKDIRQHTSWSFAQVRNNFRVLRDYEYLQLIKAKNGMANQYRLSGNYSDLDFLNTILRPEDLQRKLASGK
jgi:hypothetical protein